MLLTFGQTATRLGAKSRSFIYDRMADGTLPKPIQVGERALRFPANEIDAVIAARIAGKSKADIRELVAQICIQRAKLSGSAGGARNLPKSDDIHSTKPYNME